MSDYIPQNVLTRILLQLPVKSLVRFTLVSKTWQAFITSSDFVHTYLSRVQYPTSNNLSRSFLIRYYSELDEEERFELRQDNFYFWHRFSEINFPLKSRKGFHQIVGSCNGIVCLCDDPFLEFSTPQIILWNPSIQKHVVLPSPRIESSTQCFVLGFGFDLQRSDYKVVRLLYHNKGFYRKPVEVEIFSLKSKGWKSGNPLALRGFVNDIGQSQVYLNGIVHWMACQNEDDDDEHFENSILGFDCSDDEFIEILLPSDLANQNFHPNLHLIAHEGCLGLISYDKMFCNIWKMNEYGSAESWTQLYYLQWTHLCEVPLDKGMAKVFGFRSTGELLVTSLADQNISQRTNGGGSRILTQRRPALEQLISYNPSTRQVSKDDLLKHGRMGSFCILDYVETLSLLDVSCIFSEEEANTACLEEPFDAFQFEVADDSFKGKVDECIFQGDNSDLVHDSDANVDENNDHDVFLQEDEVDNEPADDQELDDSWVLVLKKDFVQSDE